MNLLRVLLILLLANYAFSDQGLVLRFVIEKNDDSGMRYSYENAVLVSFDNEHNFTIPEQYTLGIYAERISPDKAAVRFEYSDIQNGEAKFIDRFEKVLVVADSNTVSQPVDEGKFSYRLTLTPSYGELP